MITIVEVLLPLVVVVEILRRASRATCDHHLSRAFAYPLTDAPSEDRR